MPRDLPDLSHRIINRMTGNRYWGKKESVHKSFLSFNRNKLKFIVSIIPPRIANRVYNIPLSETVIDMQIQAKKNWQLYIVCKPSYISSLRYRRVIIQREDVQKPYTFDDIMTFKQVTSLLRQAEVFRLSDILTH